MSKHNLQNVKLFKIPTIKIYNTNLNTYYLLTCLICNLLYK